MGIVEIKKILSGHQSLDFEKAAPINNNARGIPAPVNVKGDLNCSTCSECSTHCPTKAISIMNDKKIEFDYGKCLQCGICSDLCPEGIIMDTNFIYTFGLQREELRITYEEGTFLPKTFEKSANVLSFQNITKRNGMKYREVAAAGNNSVECELNASFNNFFDSEGNQITSVASPKHADAIVFSGPVSENMAVPLQIAWDCMPEPKALIACGTEAVSGGIFPHGKLPDIPSLFISGDPPRPDVFINALRFLMGKWDYSFQLKFFERFNELKKLFQENKNG